MFQSVPSLGRSVFFRDVVAVCKVVLCLLTVPNFLLQGSFLSPSLKVALATIGVWYDRSRRSDPIAHLLAEREVFGRRMAQGLMAGKALSPS